MEIGIYNGDKLAKKVGVLYIDGIELFSTKSIYHKIIFLIHAKYFAFLLIKKRRLIDYNIPSLNTQN